LVTWLALFSYSLDCWKKRKDEEKGSFQGVAPNNRTPAVRSDDVQCKQWEAFPWATFAQPPNTSQATSQATVSNTLQRQVLQILEKRQPSVLQSQWQRMKCHLRPESENALHRTLLLQRKWLDQKGGVVCVCVTRNWSFCPFDIIAAPHFVELWTKNLKDMSSNAQPNVSRPHRCTENGRDNGSEWSKVPLLPDVTMGYSNGLKKSAKSPPRPATSKSFSTSGGNRLSSRVSAIPNR